jgi:hypothetical protein
MNVAVIGSRDFNDYELVKDTLKHIYITKLINITKFKIFVMFIFTFYHPYNSCVI